LSVDTLPPDGVQPDEFRDRLHLAVFRNPARQRIELFASLDRRDRRNRRFVARPMVFDGINPAMQADPAVSMSDSEAQVLADQLWAAGFRPTQGHGTSGQLAATEKHLDDMRCLVFQSHGIEEGIKRCLPSASPQ